MDAKDLLIKSLQSQLQAKEAALLEAESRHAATAEQFARTVEEKNHLIAQLELRIKRLLGAVRGSRQERINPDQLLLFSIKELEQLAKELQEPGPSTEPTGEPQDADPKDRPKNNRGGRRRLPDHLPREIRRYELDENDRKCSCCGETCTEFGVETSEQLEYVPATLKVSEHQRVKYSCKACQESVAVAPKPPQPIEKGLAAAGLCAFTVLSKFGDHLPLYREEDIFNRLGWDLRRSTICEWLAQLAQLARPLVMRQKYLVLQSKVIHVDDTKIKMMNSPICQETKFWPYQGDWLHPYVVFDFTLDRSRNGPQKFLKDYQGFLQADAFSGYDCIYAPGLVKEVACWIHARRYWYEAVAGDKDRANIALGYIARLTQIESQLRKQYPAKNLQGERDFDLIAAARQQHSRPILDAFKEWMEQELNRGRILPKSNIKSAFTYTLNQWDALCRYVEHGYLSMDNNAAERLVKYPAIGRKNYLFVGNEQAGHNAAVFYSLVTSAKLNGVEPYAWLRDIFGRLPYLRDGEAAQQAATGAPVTSGELDDLLPDVWLKSHPEHRWTIDEIRRQEREKKADQPRRRRAR